LKHIYLVTEYHPETTRQIKSFKSKAKAEKLVCELEAGLGNGYCDRATRFMVSKVQYEE
jgi:hypothetical protein